MASVNENSTVEELFQALDHTPENQISSDTAGQFQRLPSLVQAPWNQDQFQRIRSLIRRKRIETRNEIFAKSHSDTWVPILIEELKNLTCLVEVELLSVHGNLNYYDQFDGGVVSKLLNLTRTVLEMVENRTSEFDASETHLLENLDEITDSLGQNLLIYFASGLTYERLRKITFIDSCLNQSELENCLNDDLWKIAETLEDLITGLSPN